MMRKNKNSRHDPNAGMAAFKHYKVMVKILHDEQVEYQNLEIFTTGLPQLLELRRIHNRTIQLAEYKYALENPRYN
jgi:hypothetical protein